MARRVTWTNNSTDYDGTEAYRDTTIDPQNLPEPIATVDPVAQGAMVEYIDLTGDGDQCYAVRDFDSSGDGALSEAYCFEVPSVSWDNLSQASETGESVLTDDNNLLGLYVSPGGVEVYVASNFIDRLEHWQMSSPWDLSTAAQVGFSGSGLLGPNPTGVYLSDDGSRLFVTDTSDDLIHVYDLSTPWDLSTAANVSAAEVGITDPWDLAFNSDGSRMYIGLDGAAIDAYALSTAWDPSTASLESSLDLSGTVSTRAYGVSISDDESQLAVSSVTDIYLFNLTTPGDVSSAVFDSSVTVANSSGTAICAFVSRTEGRVYYADFDAGAGNIYEMSFTV